MPICLVDFLGRITRERNGVTSLEYAMLAVVVVAAVMAAGVVVRGDVNSIFTTVSNAFLAAIGA